MGRQAAFVVDWAHSQEERRPVMPDPNDLISDRRTVVVIVGDALGWTIDGVISGVVVRTPIPVSAHVAAEYLRAWLPEVVSHPA